jgi:hypothetical protein
MSNLIEVDERTFIANVDELTNKLQNTLLEAVKTKNYLGAEIYVAVKRLLAAYAQVLGPENVKIIEKNVLILNPVADEDYKEC